MKYIIIAIIIVYLTIVIHKFIKKIWRQIKKDRILENLEEITEYEKQKRKKE